MKVTEFLAKSPKQLSPWVVIASEPRDYRLDDAFGTSGRASEDGHICTHSRVDCRRGPALDVCVEYPLAKDLRDVAIVHAPCRYGVLQHVCHGQPWPDEHAASRDHRRSVLANVCLVFVCLSVCMHASSSSPSCTSVLQNVPACCSQPPSTDRRSAWSTCRS